MSRYVVEMPIVGRVRVVVDTDVAEVEDTASGARALVAETLSSTERTLVALQDDDVEVLRLKGLVDHRVTVNRLEE